MTLAAAAAAALLLLATPPAEAKSYDLPAARVVIRVRPDGSLAITEDITFAFSGSFSGAERKIPLRTFERIDQVAVSEHGRRYAPGASTETGSSGDPGTFGDALESHREHIVWRYQATDQVRTFTIAYHLQGAALAYDDVVEVNHDVWGDEWPAPLGQLDATLVLPKPTEVAALRAWGHPGSVAGSVELRGDRVVLHASNVPKGRRVQLHVAFPRALLSSTTGARARAGAGLDAVLASERQLDRDDGASKRRALAGALRGAGAGGVLGLLLLLGVYLGFGRERVSRAAAEAAPAFPGDLPPALVPAVLEPEHAVSDRELTATMFDLFRRRYFHAEPVGGQVQGVAADVQVSGADRPRGDLSPFEQAAASVVDVALQSGPFRLSEFSGRLAADKVTGRAARSSFVVAVKAAVAEQRWFDRRGRRVLGVLRLACLAGLVAAFPLGYWLGAHGGGPFSPGEEIAAFQAGVPHQAGIAGGFVLLAGVAGCLVVLLFGGGSKQLSVRWTEEGAFTAGRWRAFKGFLERLDAAGGEAALAQGVTWDQLLVYAVALGVSRRVLQAAASLDEQQRQQLGPLYYPGYADYGRYDRFDREVSTSLAPDPSSGGGGGFSGGYSGGSDGGGSSGGGGGGAW